MIAGVGFVYTESWLKNVVKSVEEVKGLFADVFAVKSFSASTQRVIDLVSIAAANVEVVAQSTEFLRVKLWYGSSDLGLVAVFPDPFE